MQRELEQQMAHSARALFAARLDQELGIPSEGAAMSDSLSGYNAHGGQLHVYRAAMGRGAISPPTYAELQAQGDGFKSFFKALKSGGRKVFSISKDIAKDIVSNPQVQELAKKAAMAGLEGAKAGHAQGGMKQALHGGLRAAADAGGADAKMLARQEAQRRIQGLF